MALTDEEARREERAARIEELEGNLARRTAVGIRLPVAVLAMAVAGFLLNQYRADLPYFFSSRTPLTLGTEGDYHFERLASNRYVQVHGVPTLRGAYSQLHGQTRVLVGLQETPILVYRPAVAGEAWTPGQVPPVPNQSPFGVRGRLLSEADGSRRCRDCFAKLGVREHVFPWNGQRWLLIEGEKPGADASDLIVPGVLLFFFAFNAGLLAKELRHRLRRA